MAFDLSTITTSRWAMPKAYSMIRVTPRYVLRSSWTANSWKSKSAPAARRTLIVSGTTSWPAPSHGKTAMCSGRGCFLFAQLVTLDLAGHGLGQLRHELDDVRVLKSLQARLHVLLQLDDQRVTGGRVGPRNHERFDFREPFDRDPHHRALRDSGMLQQRRLDLNGRHPQAAHLDHVVRAPLVPVVALFVDAVAVAGEEPFAEDRALRLLVLRPVQRQRAVAFHVQVTRLAIGDRVAPVVEDLQLVAGHRFAARAGAHIMRTVGAVDMQHLGRADAV